MAWSKEKTKAYLKAYRLKNKDRIKELNKNWVNKNKEAQRAYAREWYKNNKERVSKAHKESYKKHGDNWKKTRNRYYKNNIDKHNARARKCSKIRRMKPEYKIQNLLRAGIYNALKGKSKYKKTIEYLGCSFSEFRVYLEKQFKNGMNWENYGKLWHVDHILPVSKFDLLLEENQKICFHYSNMRPMLAKENMKKFNKLTEPQIKLLL